MYSITGTVLLNGLKPYDYLTFVLERMKDPGPFPEREDLRKLLPWSSEIPDDCRGAHCWRKSGVDTPVKIFSRHYILLFHDSLKRGTDGKTAAS